MHWARGGRDIRTLTSSETEKAPSLHHHSVCVYVFVCAWVCVLHGATLCKHSDNRWSCDRHSNMSSNNS